MPAIFTCALCGLRFNSLLISRMESVGEVTQNIQKHVLDKHKKESKVVMQEGAELIAIATTLAFKNAFVRLDDADVEAQKEHQELTDRVIKLLGLEEVEEEEEGEKEDEESNVSNLIEMPRTN